MKALKILMTAGLAGAVIVASAGCANYNTAGTDKPEIATTVNESVEAPATEAPALQHDVKVEDLSQTTYTDDYNNTYTSVYPKLIVDGKEATEINEALANYILKTYPMQIKTDYGYTEGYKTGYKWGVRGNVVSIVIHISSLDSDYYTNEVYNYDLDTLKAIDDSEVVKRFGMTDDDFFAKTKEILKKESDGRDLDLEKTLAAVNYDNITPAVTPDGNIGVAAGIYYAPDSQFGGMVSTSCYDLNTAERFA